jgi:hypothetical protein
MLKQVPAYEVYEVYADFDGYAPDSAAVAVVPTEAHARAVCAALNKDPRSWTVAAIDGWEHAKT